MLDAAYSIAFFSPIDTLAHTQTKSEVLNRIHCLQQVLYPSLEISGARCAPADLVFYADNIPLVCAPIWLPKQSSDVFP